MSDKHTTPQRGRGRRISPEELDDMRRMRNKGMQHKEIEALTGWHRSTICAALRGGRPAGCAAHRKPEIARAKKSKGEVRPCIKCDRMFLSWDRRRNQICPACSRENEGLRGNHYGIEPYALGW